MAVVSRQRRISRISTAETAWQAWLQSCSIGTCALADWLPRSTRLVVIAPHPDDEVLACGGLIAMHLSQGGDVALLAVSDGEASHADAPLWDPAALAATRRTERIAGLQKLGLGSASITRLALPDGAVAQHSLHLSLKLMALLRPADVVVTTWKLDGHPDHDATGFVAAQACSAVGCRLLEAPVWMWHWASPGDQLVPWHRMRRLNLRPHIRDAKLAALAAHVSQLDPSARPGGAVLDEAIVARASRTDEYFFIEQEHPIASHCRLF